MKSSHKLLKLVICLFLTIPLAGCFKGEFFVDIHPNGSATVAGSYGLNTEAKLLLGMQGENLEEQLFDLNTNGETARTSRWVDGEYEWVKVERDFETLEEVNKSFQEVEIIDHFSLTRKTGLFQNQFILDAEFDFSTTEGTSTDSLGFSASDMINFRFLARLPGSVIETNGLKDINDPNLLVWTINIDGVSPIHAKSVTWNYLNIGLIAAGFFLLAILFILLFVLFILTRIKSQTVPSQDFVPTVSSVSEKEESQGFPTNSTDGDSE